MSVAANAREYRQTYAAGPNWAAYSISRTAQRKAGAHRALLPPCPHTCTLLPALLIARHSSWFALRFKYAAVSSQLHRYTYTLLPPYPYMCTLLTPVYSPHRTLRAQTPTVPCGQVSVPPRRTVPHTTLSHR